MSNTFRKVQRSIDRRAVRQLFVQIFVNRQVWEEFEAELAQLPEDERPKDANQALHALMASWLQGRRDAKRRKDSLIQVPQLPGDQEGELTRRLRVEGNPLIVPGA